MKAVILAAGEGKRLRGITSNPKCMLEINGETLIQRQLRLLGKVYSTPVIIVGYKYKAIIEHVGHKEFIMNPIWRQSNTLISLLFAISGPPVDTLVINGDVVFREDLLPKMLEVDYSACAVQDVDPTDEEVKVKVNASGMIVEIGKYLECSRREAVGVYLFRKPLIKAIRDYSYLLTDPCKLYYEDALNVHLKYHPMQAVETTDAIEIDTPEDYERAKDMYGK
jgi:choline kinase